MDGKIIRLSETVINQIAAGEVVENPASIVKELIENSLDAGAKTISIECSCGGHERICIEDDGCGMGREDALLSIERYATSKIRAAEDLQSLATLGFRGEALAAIAAISHFEMRTCEQRDRPEINAPLLEEKNRSDLEDFSAAGIASYTCKGKSSRDEWIFPSRSIAFISGRSQTATRIVAEGGRILTVEPCARNRGTTMEVRSLFYNVPARKKFQKSAAASAAQITRMVEMLALAYPEVSFSLNGKEFVRTDWKQRLEEILGPHEHEIQGEGLKGFAAAPAKASLKRTGQYLFINRRPIFSPLIAKAVKEGFGTRIAERAYPRFALFLDVAPERVDVNVHPQKREVRFRDEGAIFQQVRKAVEGSFSLSSLPLMEGPISFSPPPAFSFAEGFSFPPPFAKEAELALDFPDRPLAVLGSYLLLQKEYPLLVDLRAAHARILFESLHSEKAASQALLWPLEISLVQGEEEFPLQLKEMGIECRLLHRTLVIDALPPCLQAAHFPQFFATWKEGRKIEQAVTRFCRSVQKTYSLEEAYQIWQQLQKCKDSTYDPLGKRIWVEIKEEKLEKLLKMDA